MKEYNITVTEEFIKQAHKEACEGWKEKIENLVPQAFEDDTLNKWTISTDGDIVFNTGIKENNYGIIDGKWSTFLWEYPEIAPNHKVEEALIEEAKRRGLVIGAKYNSLYFKGLCCEKNTEIKSYHFNAERNILYTRGGVLFQNGEWAKPVEENLTLKRIEEIENELKQLKSGLK